MEARGLISGYEGSKPRQVLISKSEWQELKMGNGPEEVAENINALPENETYTGETNVIYDGMLMTKNINNNQNDVKL